MGDLEFVLETSEIKQASDSCPKCARTPNILCRSHAGLMVQARRTREAFLLRRGGR